FTATRTDSSKSSTASKGAPKTLEDLFKQELANLVDGRKRIVAMLPKVAAAARSPALRQALHWHLLDAVIQLELVQWVAEQYDELPEPGQNRPVAILMESAGEAPSGGDAELT